MNYKRGNRTLRGKKAARIGNTRKLRRCLNDLTTITHIGNALVHRLYWGDGNLSKGVLGRANQDVD